MTKENAVTQENFDLLLNWLDRNREIAGQKYEKIRRRLIRIFLGRGCAEAEELADETINRVTQKLPQVAASYVGEPTFYFYGVANKIHLEWLRRQKKAIHLPLSERNNHSEIESDALTKEAETTAAEYECLRICLEALPGDDRRLIVEYYEEEKSVKIEKRRKLAEECGISLSTLQVKAFRIRARLKGCLQKCLAGKNRD
ncbi:MAG: RNA polymerase sigma factor [Acidobacteriota bacterium]|nr:RNA polymerase sigma factor [Acidobacteriota bacterium]